ncbi:MAG: hypothetical protein WD673_14215 [Alphaproteobacteria bacterium]
MPFVPLVLPAGTTADDEQLVRDRLDPLLADVHAMLCLPRRDVEGLEAGCNLSAALTLLDVVSGVSRWLYGTPTNFGKSGESFKCLLAEFYPWSEERHIAGAMLGMDAAEALYQGFRNPLAHALGHYAMGEKSPFLGVTIKVLKDEHGMRDDELGRIESSVSRSPSFVVPTLATDSATPIGRTYTKLTVKCLYWGVRRLVHDTLLARHFEHGGFVHAGDAPGIIASLAASTTVSTALDVLPLETLPKTDK